jgi:asparagine synthase (glutamine-hydrolysing)
MRGRFPQWFIMEEVGRHVKVVLDGFGSDEQLAGYHRFVAPYLLDRLRGPGRPSLPALGRELKDLAAITTLRAFLLSLGSPVKRRLGLESNSVRHVYRKDFARAFGPAPAGRYLESWLRRDVERPFRSHLNNALWMDFRHVGLAETLHGSDALSMAFSVEARAPFMDHRLVEFCFSLPYDEKIRDGWTKSILRRALRDVLPEEIRTRRPKLGFQAPIGSWLRRPENLREVEALLLDPRSLGRGIFDGPSLERRLRAYGAAPATRQPRSIPTEQLWRWITLELWFRRFVDEAARSAAEVPDLAATRAAGPVTVAPGRPAESVAY